VGSAIPGLSAGNNGKCTADVTFAKLFLDHQMATPNHSTDHESLPYSRHLSDIDP
jgi:hypothetical protein